jgi:hypothetical protein
MSRLQVATVLAAVALAACQTEAGSIQIDRTEAISIATAHFHEVLPQMRSVGFRPEAIDEGATWRVHFRPPPDTLGSVIVVIEKRGGRVVRHVINQ